ncbi:MAG TPA: tetratricopeptide repeat protein [Opitutaceae bacterium]|nr:tetratricopeptide repeat protein [Opitutaceae bacterium]
MRTFVWFLCFAGLAFAGAALHAQDATAVYNEAVQLYNNGQYEAAVDKYRAVTALQPDNAKAFYWLGCSYYRLKKYSEAVTSYTEATRLQPDYCDAWIYLGNSLDYVGRLNDAIDAYRKATEAKPDNPQGYFELGVAYFRAERYDDAINSYQQANQLKADYPRLQHNLGQTLRKLGRYDDALAALRLAVSQDPQDYDSFREQGLALDSQSKQAAKQEGDEAKARADDLLKQSRAMYDAALNIKSDDSSTALDYGDSYYNRNDYQTAVQWYEKAVQYDPEWATARCYLADAYVKLDRRLDAIAAYKEAVRLKSDYRDAWQALGTQCVAAGDRTEALKAYAALDPLDAAAAKKLLAAIDAMPKPKESSGADDTSSTPDAAQK